MKSGICFKIPLVPFSAPPKKNDAEQVTTNLVALTTHIYHLKSFAG